MAQQLYFSRDTKMFLEFDGYVWEIPVLDGFSFSQATNSSEITLNEMESSAGVSRRGRRAFNDSLAPGEWSFSTYVRPFTAAGATQGTGSADTAPEVHAVEEVLWALMAGANNYAAAKYDKGGTDVLVPGGSSMAVNFDSSNVAQLSTFNLYFVLGNDNRTVMKLDGCVVGEASLDFDIDGIATINWSGFAGQITDFTASVTAQASPPTASAAGEIWIDTDDSDSFFVSEGTGTSNWVHTIDEGTASTTNFIRNRLTQLSLAPDATFKANNSAVTYETSYQVAITAGNITISNNITYLTPEELGRVNQPIEHVTGTRTVTGSFTCYLGSSDAATNKSKNLFEDLVQDTETVINEFELKFDVGGTASTPRLEFQIDRCHLEIPSHSIDDVISLETNFHGLGSSIGEADEITLKYVGS